MEFYDTYATVTYIKLHVNGIYIPCVNKVGLVGGVECSI